MNKEEVTFIIPAYNADKYLGRAVDSVLAQTCGNWKMIVIDDCSTDDTAAIAAEYAAKDYRITLMSTPSPSGGCYHPRKLGIEAASTLLVSPLDADDWIDPDYLRNLLIIWEKFNADIVYPTMYAHDREKITPLMKREMCGRLLRGSECVKYTLNGWRINCNGGLLNRELYLRSYKEYPYIDGAYFYDELQTRQLLRFADSVVFSDQPYHYFVNKDSVSHKLTPKIFAPLFNSEVLKQYASDWYGIGSEESILAEQQLFYNTILGIKILESGKCDENTLKIGRKMVKESYGKIAWSRVRGHVPFHYYTALRMGISTAGIFFPLLDAVKRIMKRTLKTRHP